MVLQPPDPEHPSVPMRRRGSSTFARGSLCCGRSVVDELGTQPSLPLFLSGLVTEGQRGNYNAPAVIHHRASGQPEPKRRVNTDVRPNSHNVFIKSTEN